MIRCSDNSIYTGITTDIERRFLEHKTKSSKCAKYTYNHDVVSLECYFTSNIRLRPPSQVFTAEVYS